jgi:hypothetical protein
MKTMNRRLSKLEDRFRPEGWKPRGVFGYLICVAGSKWRLEGATCQRCLWPDDTLFETVMFPEHNAGADEVTDDELEEWIASFPVQGLNAPKGTR